MADKDGIKEGKDFGIGIPQENKPFHVKGAGALDWGMQNRLGRIFNPDSGRTVMLAFDHGYFQGPTSGLERMDLTIVPLMEHADVLMCTRGALRAIVPASINKPVVLRCSGGQSILSELSNETIAVDIDDAILFVHEFSGGTGSPGFVFESLNKLLEVARMQGSIVVKEKNKVRV